jgi:hypothetical protein
MWRSVPEVLRRFAGAAVLGLALLGATPSSAGIVTLDFDLAGSSVTVGPFGSIQLANGVGATTVSGSASINIGSLNPADPDNAGNLIRLFLELDVNTPFSPDLDASLVGLLQISLDAPVGGTFDAAGVLTLPSGFGALVQFSLTCVGTQCAPLAAMAMTTFPIAASNLAQPMTPSFALAGVASGNATLESSLTLVLEDDRVIQLNLRGRQVPEPRETALLALGVLALCAGAAARRLRVA